MSKQVIPKRIFVSELPGERPEGGFYPYWSSMLSWLPKSELDEDFKNAVEYCQVTDQPASTMQDNNTNVDNSYRAGILKAIEMLRGPDAAFLYNAYTSNGMPWPVPSALADWLRAEFVKQGILKE